MPARNMLTPPMLQQAAMCPAAASVVSGLGVLAKWPLHCSLWGSQWMLCPTLKCLYQLRQQSIEIQSLRSEDAACRAVAYRVHSTPSCCKQWQSCPAIHDLQRDYWLAGAPNIQVQPRIYYPLPCRAGPFRPAVGSCICHAAAVTCPCCRHVQALSHLQHALCWATQDALHCPLPCPAGSVPSAAWPHAGPHPGAPRRARFAARGLPVCWR